VIAKSKSHLGMWILPVFLIFILGFIPHLEAASLKIAATILPVSDMVREITGRETEIVTILPPGANPHTFELSPQLIKELDGSAVIFRIGKGFDGWIAGVSDNLPAIQLIELNQGIQLVHGDPHYWLSIQNAKVMVGHIAKTLITIDPSNQAKYQHNLNHYLQTLDQADQQVRNKLSSLPQKKIVTFHDGWCYFARDYGLEVAATVESSEGNEPTPKRLVQLQNTIQNHRLHVLFTEPAVPKSLAHSIAEDFNLIIVELDPFGIKDENKTFVNLMLHNADEIAKALNQ